MKLLVLVRSVTFSLWSVECMYMVYFTLLRRKFDYTTVVWNSGDFTDAIKRELVQKKPAVHFFNSFFPLGNYSYAYALEQLKLHILRKRRYHLFELFFTQIYLGLEFCSSVLETVGRQVPASYIREFYILVFVCSSKSCPAGCTSSAVVCSDVL